MTCFGMIAAVSLEAFFSPPGEESGFPFANSCRVARFGIWGWMHFTMCLCFGMCIISFLLCGHGTHAARCWKCLWIAPLLVERKYSSSELWLHLKTLGSEEVRTQLSSMTHTTSCCSSVSSLGFASAGKNPGSFAFWKLYCQNDLYIWKLWLCLSSVLGNSVFWVQEIRLPAEKEVFSILWNHLLPCLTFSQLHIRFTKSRRALTSLRAPQALLRAWKAVE